MTFIIGVIIWVFTVTRLWFVCERYNPQEDMPFRESWPYWLGFIVSGTLILRNLL